jgi:hypothetical protein
VVHALAMVGLVWVLAVLGALFMTMSSQGQHHDGGYSLSTAGARTQQSLSVTTRDTPRTAGLVLALLVLVGGATVLVVGATRGDTAGDARDDTAGDTGDDNGDYMGDYTGYIAAEPDPDLSLALGLGLLA